MSAKKDAVGTKPELIRISVRSLVEFILRSGDIDNRTGSGVDTEAMLAGGRVHRKIQKGKAGDYRAEVPLVMETDRGDFVLRVEGRADGIFTDAHPLKSKVYVNDKLTEDAVLGDRKVEGDDGGLRLCDDRPGPCDDRPRLCVDEIKGIYMDVRELTEPQEVHLAQAKCYAAILFLMDFAAWDDSLPDDTEPEHDRERIGVRMTYVDLEHDDRINMFDSDYGREELLAWFDSIVERYSLWCRHHIEHKRKRDASMGPLTFPFEYRTGQKNLVSSVYRTILGKQELFLMAPTGDRKSVV